MEKEYFFINNKMSAPMEELITQFDSFEQFEKHFSKEFLEADARLGRHIDDLLYKYNKSCSAISQDAGYASSYLGHIVRGERKNPKRDMLIKICILIGTTVDELQHLLKYAGYAPLYVRRKRDVIIWFGLMKKKSLYDINIDLEKHGMKLLCKDE